MLCVAFCLRSSLTPAKLGPGQVCKCQELGISALLCLLLKDSIWGWKEPGQRVSDPYTDTAKCSHLKQERSSPSHIVTQQDSLWHLLASWSRAEREVAHFLASGLGPHLMAGLSLLSSSSSLLEIESVSKDTGEGHWPGGWVRRTY